MSYYGIQELFDSGIKFQPNSRQRSHTSQVKPQSSYGINTLFRYNQTSLRNSHKIETPIQKTQAKNYLNSSPIIQLTGLNRDPRSVLARSQSLKKQHRYNSLLLQPLNPGLGEGRLATIEQNLGTSKERASSVKKQKFWTDYQQNQKPNQTNQTKKLKNQDHTFKKQSPPQQKLVVPSQFQSSEKTYKYTNRVYAFHREFKGGQNNYELLPRRQVYSAVKLN